MKLVESGFSEKDLAAWLLEAFEMHAPAEKIQLALIAKFGVEEDDARIAFESAHSAILRAISGSRKEMPDLDVDPVGHATFNMVWRTLNQNSFFDRRRTPTRKWLEWKEQQRYG